MPATVHDNYDKHAFYIYAEHAHYVDLRDWVPIDDYLDLDHGKPISRTYRRDGDWYAVHSH